MSALVDNSTTTTESPANMTELAGAFGRVEAGLGYLKESVDRNEVNASTDRVLLASHSIAIAKIEGVQTEHTNILANRAPQRFGWPAVLGVIAAAVFGIAGTVTGIITVLKP